MSNDLQKITATVRSFLGYREGSDLLKLFGFCLLIGIVAGLGAFVFGYMVHQAETHLLGGIAGYHPPAAGGEAMTHQADNHDLRRWMLILLPALGGLASGLIVYSLAPEAEGHGTDAVIESFHHKQGFIRPLVPFVKIIASALTIGTGGSAGREGPVAQIGAGFGSFMAQRLKLSAADRRMMILIGAGAGIGAIFKAPLGGAIFAATVLYRETDYEHGALMPGLLASVTAYAVYAWITGNAAGTVFTLQTDFAINPLQLPFFLLLGVVLVPGAYAYTWFFYASRDKFFSRIPLPKHVIPAIGGLGLGLMAFLVPGNLGLAVLGSGYGWLQQAMDGGQLTLGFMLALAALKILATSMTISSGGSGGVFAPSLVIGGLLGAVLGELVTSHWPGLFPDVAPFVLVGMAAYFAAVAKVPIASLVMVSEMTGGYELLVPAMLAITVAYLLSGTRWSIYENQVANRISSPAHKGDYVTDVLEDIYVKDLVDASRTVETIDANASLTRIYSLFAHSDQHCFPVLDTNNHVKGFVPVDLVRSLPDDENVMELVVALDVMETQPVIRPDQRLSEALQTLMGSGLTELPVVTESGDLVGMLSRRQMLAAYYNRMRQVVGDKSPGKTSSVGW